MISEERPIKHTGGRPKKASKKDVIKGIRFSYEELNIIQQKAATAGMHFCEYIRAIAINKKISSRLTEEERNYARQLTGMATT